MISRFFALTAILLLGACAFIYDTQQQRVTFNTVGAKHAVCYVWTDGPLYRIYPPQTITINRSSSDMTVDCHAPGNRAKQLTVPALFNSTTMLNVANGGAGAPFDALSAAMYMYPERIEIDFTGQTAGFQPLPAHEDPDLIPPGEHRLDEYGPTTPRLNSDLDQPAYSGLERRTPAEEEGGYDSFDNEPVSYSDKGDLEPVGKAPAAHTAAPSAETSAPADSYGPVRPNAMANPAAQPEPAPSYPGQ